ncbi:FmdB family zinc ribbon protein [Chloroflexota bacterium]
MPIYEFLCQKCHTKTNVLVKSVNAPLAAQCSACDSSDLVRCVSRFAYHKSLQTVWEESGEPQRSPSPDYYKDPRNIGRSTEKRFKELGLDMPQQIKGEIQAAREGELPKSLKEKL